MTQHLLKRPSLRFSASLAVVAATLAAAPALAATGPTDPSGCSTPALSQPFLSANDSNWYTLAPGQTPDNFNGGGWTLTAGAKITTTQLQSGQTGSVLNLATRSTAVSPPVCVTSDYLTARTIVRNVTGAQGVRFYVSYADTNGWGKPQRAGRVNGSGSSWTLSQPVKLHPRNVTGWQLVRFTFVPDGDSGDFQIYNLYVDPRMGS